MAQRYRPGVAHERMAKELCPECGHHPDEHPDEPVAMFQAGVCGFGGLLRTGAWDRILQYRADLEKTNA